MQLGDRIYKLRTQKNMSQGELADALEVSRQSVSKWETNASVPELDKLVKLSELFGVSLDELVLDSKQPKCSSEPEQKIIYVEKPASKSAQKYAGVVLLCFAALLFLMLALFGDVVAGLVLAAPFAACGLICLFVKKNAGLWCSWVVYFFVDMYLRLSTGINWYYVFVSQVYTSGMIVHLIVAWALLGTFALLTIITTFASRKIFPGTLRGNLIGTAASWVVYFLSGLVLTLPADRNETDFMHSFGFRFVTAVSGWIRSVVVVVAVVFAVRLIISLIEKLKNR